MQSSNQLKVFKPEDPIAALDGQGFKALVRAGLGWLETNHEHVNSLNVFPVPDGDTGTNMLLTMRSAWREIENMEESDAGHVAHAVYNGALMGARGNSGVILSQLWRGFARALEGYAFITPENVGACFHDASVTAYSAVQSPVEGTLLTVAREAGEEAEVAASESSDLRDILDRVLKACHASVQRTPELLPVLKEAGVVDSGGMGFTYIIEGMLRYMNGEAVLPMEMAEHETQAAHSRTELSEAEAAFPYDVQFLIKGKSLNVDSIRNDIEAMGDSGVIVGDPSLVKVHIHVVDPGIPLSYAAERGALLDVVVENMVEQFYAIVGEPSEETENDIAPPTVEPGSIGVVSVAPGAGFRNIFYSLGAGFVIEGGQTMNPSTAEIVEAINDLPTDKVIVLPNNKNILMAAQQAAKQIKVKQVQVVPTRTIPQGISALLALDPDGDLDNIADSMQESSTMVETGELTIATRTAKIDGLQVEDGQIIGLHNDKLVVAGEDLNAVMLDLLTKMEAVDFELITLYYGADVTAAQAQEMADFIQAQYTTHEIEVRSGGQAFYYYILSVE